MVKLQKSSSTGAYFVTIPKSLVEALGYKKGENFKIEAKSKYIKFCR